VDWPTDRVLIEGFHHVQARNRTWVSAALRQYRPRLAIHGIPGRLADPANYNRSLGAVVKPCKRDAIGRRTRNWRHRWAHIRADLSEGMKTICPNRGDEKQTEQFEHELLLLRCATLSILSMSIHH